MTDLKTDLARLYINGQLCAAQGEKTYSNSSPLTEEIIGEAADASLADAERAIAAARQAFDNSEWSRDHRYRLQCLRRFVEGMQEQAALIRQAVGSETGATQMFVNGPQVDGPLSMASWPLDFLERFNWQREIGEYEVMGIKSQRRVWKEAAGVVAAISPWNFPLQINLAKCIPALAAGCTVILKAAPETPWSASVLGKIAEEAGMPAGVFNVLTAADPAAIGELLSTDPRVDVVSFTGSTAVGRAVMRNAADTVKRVFLELGGKSAMVVLDDADLGSAMFGVFGVCAHSGQGCAITTRLLVPREKLAEAEQLAVAYLGGMPYGSTDTRGEMQGPLISQRQRDRVLACIEKGKAEGAKLILGGGVPQHIDRGYFVEPTVFSEVDNSMSIAQEEIFGPVLAIIPYKDEADALRIANDSIYGLSGGVFSASEERALNFASRLRTGTVNINGGNFLGPDAPFGGYKQSGVGREMGPEGFEEYLETKTVALGCS
ncbi:aldehyde dehydrogenase family protein [Spongiibacter sp. KMU-158]|uniref:Aldehyde dehydrogenase family protein n=1 Tax=Spongiibacter pelagi TaxID=2760804 RepID=A0A927C0X0_9GAMM|nr:aldehyde dehydrogenase family protein [Spongiibacter pelagi]MBD2857847.1 aldehyde dehydrogenase family protein [Spongiibacter pelagi]